MKVKDSVEKDPGDRKARENESQSNFATSVM